VEEAIAFQRLRPVGVQDQVAELTFLARERLLALLAGKTSTDVQIRLPLVATEIQNLECAERLARFLEFPLHLDQTLTGGVDGELAEIGADPLATELLRYSRCCTRAGKEIGHEVTFIATRADNSLK